MKITPGRKPNISDLCDDSTGEFNCPSDADFLTITNLLKIEVQKHTG